MQTLNPTPLRVMIVDDDPSMRHMLGLVLASSDVGIELIGEAADGTEAVTVAKTMRPDLIVLDHCMPECSGAEAVPDLRRACPQSEIIFFSAYLDSPNIGESLRRVVEEYEVKAIPKAGIAQLEEAIGQAVERLNKLN